MLSDTAILPFARFEELARNFAALDVELGEEPRHRLAAYKGEEVLALVDLRPFPRGGIESPMVEAMAGVMALGADRFGVALPGRAWSLEDPIPPVTEDTDLRQRVLSLTTATRAEGVRCWLVPFELDDGRLTWHEAVLGEETGPVEGWVPHALGVAARSPWDPDPDAAREQLTRCSALGHLVMLAPLGAAVLHGDG